MIWKSTDNQWLLYDFFNPAFEKMEWRLEKRNPNRGIFEPESLHVTTINEETDRLQAIYDLNLVPVWRTK